MHLDEVFIGTDRLPAGTGLLVYFATSFATAALLWALVERPFLQLRSRLLAPSAVDRDSA
jgi:peptidoglycan/LPS O-acetylase OafA/YrhL